MSNAFPTLAQAQARRDLLVTFGYTCRIDVQNGIWVVIVTGKKAA